MIDVKLITFLTIAQIRNFTKAGQLLNITQPAVSQHIKLLETQLGVKLLKKQGREIKLTEEGEILWQYGKKMEILAKNLTWELENKNKIRRIYNVGATLTIGDYLLPYLLGQYKNSYQNIDIKLHIQNTKIITEKLLRGEIQLALVEGPFDRQKFLFRKLADDQLVLAVSQQHEFAKKKQVQIEDVLKGQLILREKGSGTRDVFRNKLQELNYPLETIKPYMEIGSINAIKSLVEANLGYTIISQQAIKKEVEAGIFQIVPIKGIKIWREFNFIYLPGIAEKFREHFIKFCFLHKEI